MKKSKSGFFLASLLGLLLSQTAWSQAAPGSADPRLETKVKYSAQQASVQDIVQNLAGQAGLNYDRQKSFAQTDPLCRRWVRNVNIDGTSCREAIEQILKPVGLGYQVEDGTVVLSRLTNAPGNNASPAGTEKSKDAGFSAGGGALDARLNAKVSYQTEQASVQDIVQELARQAGLNYDWQKSFAQTDPVCRQWVRNVTIENKTCREALDQILKPVGLRYRVQDGAVVLSRAGKNQPQSKAQQPGKGYVTTGQPPTDLIPGQELSAAEQRENFDFLCRAIDETYAGFELKSINWGQIRLKYAERLPSISTTDEYYRLLFHLVNELKDTHSWLQNYHVSLPGSRPDLALRLFDGRPFVVAVGAESEAAQLGVEAGWEVVEVDGTPVAAKMEQLRSVVPGRSTERAFRGEACRYLLAGEPGSTLNLKLRSSEGRFETFTLKRTAVTAHRPAQTCALTLTRQRFVHFGRLPVGLGYIRIESFDGRTEVADEFDRALETLRTAPGLILDIRDNPGGYGQPRIVGRLVQRRTLGAISYLKSGPGHRDLERHDDFLEPSGPWQYTGPIALLINEETGSAADLFACCLRSANRVTTLGATTHGNLSGVAAFAVLPCGLVVRISNGYICDAKGRPIEGVGNQPDIAVSPSITDFLAGKDPVLEKAAAVLLEKPAKEA